MTKINEVVRIKPGADVEWGILTQMKILSDFDLKMFPFDSHTLTMAIESVSYRYHDTAVFGP